ncbi:MAG: TIR domain-containing protein [Bacteroidota bacterium]
MSTYTITINRKQRFICAALLFFLFQGCQPPVSVSITDDEAAISSRTTAPAMQRADMSRREAPASLATPDALLPRMQHVLPRPPYCTRIFPTATGDWVRFIAHRQSFQAELLDTLRAGAIARRIPVGGPHDPRSFLAWLAQQDDNTAKARIHVLPTAQPPYTPVVYLGKLGLLGGTPQEEENSDETSLRPYDVFVSHAGEDKEMIAIPLYTKLVEKNPHMRVFLDRDEIPYGEDAPASMIHAMNTARCGVFILSPEFAAKKWPMKELDCFLKRKKAAEDEGATFPFLIPVFYRLTLQDLDLDGSVFFKRYQSVFEEPAHEFSDREKKGEISVAGIMQSLQALKICRGVELRKSGEKPLTNDALIDQTADVVYEKTAGMLPKLPPGNTSGQLHDYIDDFPEVSNYIQRVQATEEVHAALNKQGICVIHGFGGSGKSTLAVQYAKDNQEDQVIRFVPAASSNHALTEGFQYIAQELGQDWRKWAKFYRNSPRAYHKALGQLVYRAIVERAQRLFLIIDNVEAQHK